MTLPQCALWPARAAGRQSQGGRASCEDAAPLLSRARAQAPPRRTLSSCPLLHEAGVMLGAALRPPKACVETLTAPHPHDRLCGGMGASRRDSRLNDVMQAGPSSKGTGVLRSGGETPGPPAQTEGRLSTEGATEGGLSRNRCFRHQVLGRAAHNSAVQAAHVRGSGTAAPAAEDALL